jgi:hypothetical protein
MTPTRPNQEIICLWLKNTLPVLRFVPGRITHSGNERLTGRMAAETNRRRAFSRVKIGHSYSARSSHGLAGHDGSHSKMVHR